MGHKVNGGLGVGLGSPVKIDYPKTKALLSNFFPLLKRLLKILRNAFPLPIGICAGVCPPRRKFSTVV